MTHMKRYIFLLLPLFLLLTACASKGPDFEALGWEDDWTAVGDLLAAEGVEGFTPEEGGTTNASGIWYAAWSAGEKGESEDFGTYYGAEIFLLVQECENETEAESAVKAWSGYERASFIRGEATAREYAGQTYQIAPLSPVPEADGSPYHDGAEAFAVRGKLAISVELLCQESFQADREAVLTQFLSGLHFKEG